MLSRISFALIFSLIFLAGPADAAKVIHFEVDPGKADRIASPVTARLEIGKQVDAASVKALGDSMIAAVKVGNQRIVGQIEKAMDDSGKVVALSIHWIQPALKAGQKQAGSLTLTQQRGDDPTAFRFVDAKDGRDLFQGKRPIYRHMTLKHDPKNHHDTYKHFHHLYGMHGDGYISKGPGGKFTHHRGLYIGWSKTRLGKQSFDFWHCRKPTTAIHHIKYLADVEQVGPVLGRTASVAEWRDGDEVIVRETRTITAWQQPAGRSLLDITFKLEAVAGDIVLDGDPQHAGFQFRAHSGVEKKHAKYVRPESASGGKGDVWKTTRWCVNQFAKEDHNYAVMHMNAASNPECVYSTRNYGRFGSYFKTDLKKGTPLVLHFRVLVHDRDQHKVNYVHAFDDYLAPVSVTFK